MKGSGGITATHKHKQTIARIPIFHFSLKKRERKKKTVHSEVLVNSAQIFFFENNHDTVFWGSDEFGRGKGSVRCWEGGMGKGKGEGKVEAARGHLLVN